MCKPALHAPRGMPGRGSLSLVKVMHLLTTCWRLCSALSTSGRAGYGYTDKGRNRYSRMRCQVPVTSRGSSRSRPQQGHWQAICASMVDWTSWCSGAQRNPARERRGDPAVQRVQQAPGLFPSRTTCSGSWSVVHCSACWTRVCRKALFVEPCTNQNQTWSILAIQL